MVEIYFDDLTEKCQKEILEVFGIDDPKEMNWDVMPIAEIPEPDEDE